MKEKKTKALAMDIGISEADREKIAEGLSALLADSYTLYLMTHNFHWNVTGPMFNTLHQMFMAQYTELWNAVDPIAERIRELRQGAEARRIAACAFRDNHRVARRAERGGPPRRQHGRRCHPCRLSRRCWQGTR